MQLVLSVVLSCGQLFRVVSLVVNPNGDFVKFVCVEASLMEAEETRRPFVTTSGRR